MARATRSAAATTPTAPPPEGLPAIWQQMQAAQLAMLENLGRDASVLLEETATAGRPGDLPGLQLAYAGEVAAQLMRTASQCLSFAFDAQSSWLRQLEAGAAIWLGNALPATAVVPGAEAWQSLWTEANKVWLSAIAHDVETAAPPLDRRRPRPT